MSELYKAGKISMATSVWVEGMDSWERLDHCLANFPALSAELLGGYSGPAIVHYEVTEDTPSDAVGIETFRMAVKAGDITDATKVWAEGMPEWTPLGECKATFGL